VPLAGSGCERGVEMGMRKKAAERPSPQMLEPEEVTSFGEDPELLDPAEEAALNAGNADPAHTAADRRPAAAPETGSDNPDSEPLREQPAEGADEERGAVADDQVHKIGPNDTVPAWSLVKERQENRILKRNLDELTRKLAEHEERWNRASERLRQLQERTALDTAAARAAADPEPDPNADPQAHYQWELRQHRRALEALHQQQQVSTAQAQAAQHQAMLSGLEQQFVLNGHPDYYERIGFLRERRNRELELMGYSDAAERAQIIANEAAMLVGGAIRQGRNPAQVAHELSEQWGYQPASADGGQGGASAADRIRDLQRKKAAAASLQAIPSRPAQGPLTLEDIAEMDDETYERYVDKNGGDLGALFRSGR